MFVTKKFYYSTPVVIVCKVIASVLRLYKTTRGTGQGVRFVHGMPNLVRLVLSSVLRVTGNELRNFERR